MEKPWERETVERVFAQQLSCDGESRKSATAKSILLNNFQFSINNNYRDRILFFHSVICYSLVYSPTTVSTSAR